MPSAIRHFVIAFLIGALIFGIVGAIGLGWFGKAIREKEKSYVTDETKDATGEDGNESDEGNLDHPALKGQSFSMLLILNDYQPDRYEYGIPEDYAGIVRPTLKKADSIVYLRFNRETATLYTAAIPTDMLITVEGVSMTLSEAYHYTDGAYLCERIASALGTRINYYCDATYDQLVSLVNSTAMNGATMTLPQDIRVTLRSQSVVTLKQGNQFMDGERVLALLRAGSVTDVGLRAQLQTDFAHVLLEKLTTLENKRNPEKFYNLVLKNLTTNLTAELVVANADMMFAYFDLEQKELTVPGQYNGEGEFVLDSAAAKELFHTGAVLE